METKREILIKEYIKKYKKELEELNNKELKNDFIGWFCYDYCIEELEKVERNEMIFDMVEDKKNYLKEYETEAIKDYIN